LVIEIQGLLFLRHEVVVGEVGPLGGEDCVGTVGASKERRRGSPEVCVSNVDFQASSDCGEVLRDILAPQELRYVDSLSGVVPLKDIIEAVKDEGAIIGEVAGRVDEVAGVESPVALAVGIESRAVKVRSHGQVRLGCDHIHTVGEHYVVVETVR